MAEAQVQSIAVCLESLLSNYADDLEAAGTLRSMQRSLESYLTVLPEKLLQDIKTILHLLVDVKQDNAQLWQEVLRLKDRLVEVEAQLKTSNENLALRQLYHALNEKLLRYIAADAGQKVKDL
jgi:hypothetical protein